MLYFVCPTCGTELAKKQLPFEEKVKKISSDSKLNDIQKTEKKTNALNEVGAKNQCCRMRLLTFIKTVEVVK